MPTIRYKKGDVVCRKRLHHREFLRVICSTKTTVTCFAKNTGTTCIYNKKEIHKYVVGHIKLERETFKRIISGRQKQINGPMTESWKKITVSAIHPVPEIIKICNNDGDYAYFEYIEAARCYFSNPVEIKIKLQIGEKIRSL